MASQFDLTRFYDVIIFFQKKTFEFEEEFKKQEVNIANIISSNFTLTIKEIKSLKQEVNDLKQSKEFTQSDLEEKSC